MALNSINTNVAAYYAQQNIGKASTSASLSISRLSSGERIVRAADDVAALATGTSLRTNVTTLKMALINTSQGASLLQVADGALGQITDILQRQKAIAVQAGSGSLSNTERGFLNQEFQNLSQEIDRLVAETNFNGVNLLNGRLSESVDVSTNSAKGTNATGSISWVQNVSDGDTLLLNGVTFQADIITGATAGVIGAQVMFTVGGSIQETIDNLVTVLNSINNGSTTGTLSAALNTADVLAINQASYSRDGNSLVITNQGAGSGSQRYLINATSSTAISGANEAVVNAKGANSVLNLLTATAAFGATSISDSLVTAGARNTVTPFQIGDQATVSLGTAGTTFTLFTVAAGDTLESIVNRINSNTDVTGFQARIVGRSGAYNIQLEHSRVTGNNSYLTANAVDITVSAFTAAINTGFGVNSAANTATLTTNNFNFYIDANDSDLGIASGDVVGKGIVGNNILTDQTQLRAEVSLIFPEIADADLNTSTYFGAATPLSVTLTMPIAGTLGATPVTFSFVTEASAQTDVAIGDTLEETLDNLVAKINNYNGSAAENFALANTEAYRDGNTVKFRDKNYGATMGITGGTTSVTISTSATFASVTGGGTMNNGVSRGVNTNGVTNDDFIGTISGFQATYTGTTDRVNASITVGDFTYTADNISANVTTNTLVRFVSLDGGGYFDIQLQANTGQSVSSAADATTFATRLDAAFSSLEFYQNREVSSYTGSVPINTEGEGVTGTLIGTSFELQSTDFTDVKIDYIRVSAPQGSSENGSFIVSIGGEEYRTAGNIGSSLGAYQSIQLINENDADKILTFNTGAIAIDFDSDAKAAAFEAALKEAFGVGDGSAELKFQVGTTVADTLSVGISNASTRSIFGGQSLDVSTAATAANASAVLDDAIDMVTSIRAEVGAMQSRFDFAAATIEISIQNQDAARGVLLDTDIAAESTAFATSQVQLQAGIAVLAQANLLPQNMLKLIG